MTKSPESLESPVMRSSVTPSLKYSWLESWLRFANGSTAIDGLSGRASPAAGADEHEDDESADEDRHAPAPRLPPLRRPARSGGRVEPDAIHAQRPGDVLHRVLAEEVVGERQLSLHLIVGGAGKADAAALGQPFEARRNVDAVAVEPGVLHDHVAEVDADTKPHAAGVRKDGVARAELALDLDRGLDRVDHARELGKHVITGRVHHTAVVAGHDGGDDLTVLGDGADGGRLVVPHETAVALRVGA